MRSLNRDRRREDADVPVASDAETTEATRTPRIAEALAARLRTMIVSGELTPGELLPPENVLVGRFGVSRPTLREALRILEAEHLIVVRRGKHGGAQVLAPEGSTAARQFGLVLQHRGTRVRDVYDSNGLLETHLVAELARTRSTADLDALEDLLAAMGAAVGDARAYSDAYLDFHRGLVELFDNRALTLCHEIISSVLAAANAEEIRKRGDRSLDQRIEAQKVYTKLVALIRAQDVEGARKHWTRHMAATTQLMAADDASVVELLS
jgi:DNA-binding FadR family transcriptional regulator